MKHSTPRPAATPVTRAQEWHERYAQLQTDEKHDRRKRGVPEPTTYTYSDAALSTFPRYNVLHAIQAAVEAMTPDDFESLYGAREKVAVTAEVADSIFTRPPHGEIEQQAMADERASFVAYVRGLTPEALAIIEPLPFQRTLSADESARLWNELERRWGVKGYWYPLDRAPKDEPPAHTVAFAAEAFNSSNVLQCLRDVLRQLGVRRVWELRETEADT